MTDQGTKPIKDLKRGDLILTNDGYQPLSKLDIGDNYSDDIIAKSIGSKDFMVKIPKDFFAENVPSEDVFVTKTHPLSVTLLSDKDDTDFEFLHLFVEELVQLGIEFVRLDKEKHLYNLIFDNHYEINVGNMKFLSHHPNHFNHNVRLVSGDEIDPSNRSKKVYADKNGLHFKKITLKRLLDKKPEKFTDKEFLAKILIFDKTFSKNLKLKPNTGLC